MLKSKREFARFDLPLIVKFRPSYGVTRYSLGLTKNISFNNECSLDELQLLDANSWHEKLHRYWSPGFSTAHKQLNHFIDNALVNYNTDRDFPAVDATSRLSPYLHFGEIGPRQIWHHLRAFEREYSSPLISKGVESAQINLIWSFGECRLPFAPLIW